MSITDNNKIIIKVCKCYFEDELSQKEISAKLSISRPQISRILAYAKANNIVSVKINDPFENESELEYKIANKFGLTDVVVLNTSGFEEEEAFHEFARRAAEQLEAYVPDNSVVGVMSGRTLSEIVKEITHIDRKNISVVPLVGGDGNNGSDWHANVIAQNFAKKSGGKYYFLNAPVIMGNSAAADLLKNEPSIQEVLKMGKSCDVTIIGIGTIDRNSTSGQASHLTIEEANELKKNGAIAAACVSYINQEGGFVQSEITERLIGQSLKDLEKSKTIALATGITKAEAIRATLNTKCIDILFTDLETALKIIQE